MMDRKAESQIWQTVEILFEHFTDKPTYTRQEIAKGLGDVHFNTIYKDEQILLGWCEPYAQSLRRRQRLNHYQVWLLAICRMIVCHYGKRDAESFFFNNGDKLTRENFEQFRREKSDCINQAKRIHAA